MYNIHDSTVYLYFFIILANKVACLLVEPYTIHIESIFDRACNANTEMSMVDRSSGVPKGVIGLGSEPPLATFFVLPELPQLQKPLSAAFAPDLITRHRDRLQCSLTDVYKSASGFVPSGNAEPHYTGYTHGNLYYSCPLPLHVPLAPTVKSLATGLQSSHETRH